MNFQYKHNQLTIETYHGVVVDFHMDDMGQCDEVCLDQVAFENDDTLHGIYVLVDDALRTVYEVMIAAQLEYDQLKMEHELEEAEMLRHQDEISSPFLTGRV